ncbi:MAG: hypothetical protein V1725_07005 [archaeon]
MSKQYATAGGKTMDELDFFDVKGKKKFKSNNYKIVQKGARYFAVTRAPSGIEAWRVISNPNKKK